MKPQVKALAWMVLMPFFGTLLVWTAIISYLREGIIDWVFVYGVLFLLNLYIAGSHYLFPTSEVNPE